MERRKPARVKRTTPKKSQSRNPVEEAMINRIANQREIQELLRALPEELRQDVMNGTAPDDIYRKNSALAAARIVAIAATEKNPSVALAAAKDMLDRTYGRAVERKEVKHSLEKLSDNELDAILVSELDGISPEE